MPALTITAVDSATDQLTIVGHGLNTGDGPAAVRNVGGGLPGGLAALTDYWIIRVDADTVKLASSKPNALAGTAIDLATDGTGTQILEIGIPYRRARSYAPLAQIKSDDLNAMMDSWKALHALLTGQAQSIWSDIELEIARLYETTSFEHGHPACAWARTTSATSPLFYGTFWAGDGDQTIYSPLTYLRPGDKIGNVDWVYDRGSEGVVTMQVVRAMNIDGSSSVVSTLTDDTTAFYTKTVMAVDHTIEAGSAYYLLWSHTHLSQFSRAHVHVTRPRA